MNELNIEITFEGLTTADGNRAAADLRADLEATDAPPDRIELARANPDTQDAGAILAVVLSAPAVLALAKAVHAYVVRTSSRVVIRTPDGEVVATGDGAKNIDVSATVAALRAVPPAAPKQPK